MKRKDKGFELQYAKLSYRRKFIRTIWLIPVGIAAIILFQWRFANAYLTVAVSSVLCIVTIVQAFCNYRKWKREVY